MNIHGKYKGYCPKRSGEKITNISFITKIEITNKTKIKIKAKTSKYKYNAYCIDSKIQRTKKLKK